MSKANVYSIKGVKTGTISLPKTFSEKENKILLAQAIRVYQDNLHPRVSKVKTRGEITASKRKIYRQKGTGRARHGALSAPIFVGGGIAHGPKGLKRQLTLPKKMKSKALAIALSMKVKGEKIAVVSSMKSIKKTKESQILINKIIPERKKKENKVTIVLKKDNKDVGRVFRNIKNVKVELFKDLNAYSVYFGGVFLIDKEVFEKKKTVEKEVKKENKK